LSETVPLRVLLHRRGGQELLGLPEYLTACRVDVSVAGPRAEIRPEGHQVVVALDQCPLADQEADALADHLRAGGGLVTLGATLAAWAANPRFAALVGRQPADLAPETELRVRPAPGSPFAARLDPELLLRDGAHFGAPPEDSERLLTVPWHYAERVVGWSRAVGAGRLVNLGLGARQGLFAETAYQQLVHRCVRAATGLDASPPIGVGLYGYGAIGREHAGAIGEVEGLELAAVCDRVEARRADAAARHGVPAVEDAAELLANPDVELVVVGVPPVAHAAAVLECLRAGKHVVCEKPFALTADDADRMVAAAAEAQRTVTVYQSRRWDPDFRAMLEAVRAGAIGEPFYLESFIGGFGHPCSYWHSHEPVSGGTIFDWGSHHFDWILRLLPGRVARVAGSAVQRVWHDVTNADQVRVDVTFEGGEQAMFLQSDVAAASKPKWYLLGTRGSITGDYRLERVTSRAWTGDLVEERLQPAESPATVRVHRPDGHGGVSVEQLSQAPRVRHGFYRNLADHLLASEPLAVPAAEARRNVAVMEAATRSIAEGGRPVELSPPA
jgi:predicted dehydrogenase